MEGAGEDPWWGAQVAAARVRGLQGKIGQTDRVLACVKHFAAYGAVESGREYNNVDVSRVALWNKYLPPYESAVKAGAATVMNAFNVFEGVPASGNKFLVTDVLRKQWGFRGLVVSDWASFAEMIAHGYAADSKDAALKAMQAGSDMDMEAQVSYKNIPALVKEGKVTMAQLDDAVGRILKLKFMLGLFDDPYRFSDEQREQQTLFTAAHRAQAREAARKSIVLLQNRNSVLPLADVRGKQVAVIGALADSKDDLFDFWIAQGNAKDAVSLLEGLRTQMGDRATVRFAPGYALDGKPSDALIAEAVNLANSADVLIVNIGISGKLAGEERSLANPEIPAAQQELLRALRKTGKPIVAVVSSGRPLILTPLPEMADAIVQAWILGTEHGNALADVLSGAYNPDAKTVMTFPYAVGQIPVYYNHFNTGRPVADGEDGAWKSRYRDIPNAPLYPFGFGMGYSSFAYKDLKLDKSTAGLKDNIRVSITVTNTGKYQGNEVVQLYIRDVAASVIRPVKELKGFQRVNLVPGESKTISFMLTPADLSFRDATGKPVLEPGVFKVMVGGNSRDVLTQELVLK
jgi:beta-glucosidase